MQLLGSCFRPEFLNRIDEIVFFRGLGHEQLREIAGLLLEQTRRRLQAQGVTLQITQAALVWLAGRGFQPEFGARPLRRTIQRELDDELAELLLAGQLNRGDTAAADVSGGKLHITASAAGTGQLPGGPGCAGPDRRSRQDRSDPTADELGGDERGSP
jgi:ATP-dependent Clp protease ATP-binding subunit ClpC